MYTFLNVKKSLLVVYFFRICMLELKFIFPANFFLLEKQPCTSSYIFKLYNLLRWQLIITKLRKNKVPVFMCWFINS